MRQPFSPLEEACNLLTAARALEDQTREVALAANADGHDDGPFLDFANSLKDAMGDLIWQAKKLDEYQDAERESREREAYNDGRRTAA